MAEQHQLGDTFFAKDGKSADAKESFAERYYKQMLFEKTYGADLVKSLASEQDTLRKKALDKIAKIPTSSPEFAQLASFFKTTDKLEIAQKLADDMYAKELYKSIMNSYGLDKKEVITEILANEDKALNARRKRKEALEAQKSRASLSASILGGGRL